MRQEKLCKRLSFFWLNLSLFCLNLTFFCKQFDLSRYMPTIHDHNYELQQATFRFEQRVCMKYIGINYIKNFKHGIKNDKAFNLTHLHCKQLTILNIIFTAIDKKSILYIPCTNLENECLTFVHRYYLNQAVRCSSQLCLSFNFLKEF